MMNMDKELVAMKVIVGIFIVLSIYMLITKQATFKEVGWSWIGIIFKFLYSCVAISICMAIPIPIINIIIAIYWVIQIWASPVG